MKCKELQVGDKVALINGIIATIVEAGEGYAYATLNGYETMDPWEFNDQDNHPEGIPLTKEILDANGFRYEKDHGPFYRSILGSYSSEYYVCVEWKETPEGRKICYIDCEKRKDGRGNSATIRREFYVHTFQQALRLVGLSEIADNFKV